MFKLDFRSVFSVILLITALHVTQGNDDSNNFRILNEYIDALVTQRRLILCMAESCDPEAIPKLNQIAAEVEEDLKKKPAYTETHETESQKLDNVVKLTLTKIMALEPTCKDPKFVCPTPVLREIPKYVTDYTEATGDIIAHRKCINMQNIQQAVDIVGTCVDYVEHDVGHPGGFFVRGYPAVAYIAKELRKLCDKA